MFTKIMKKTASVVLSMIMILGMFTGLNFSTIVANAAGDLPNANGANGTEERPYIINEPSDFTWIQQNFISVRNCYFLQTADINLSGYSWTPIGDFSTNFRGTYNGNGHTIDNLTINDSSFQYPAMFGVTYGATIENVTLSNVSINGCYNSTSTAYTAGIVGSSMTDTSRNIPTKIENCHVISGSITGTANNCVAGIAGLNNSGCYIQYCSNSANIQAGNTTASLYAIAAGIAGINNGDIDNCFNTGSITAGNGTDAVGSGIFAGGIAGHSYSSGNTVANCYSTGSITAQSGSSGVVMGAIVGNDGTITTLDATLKDNYFLQGSCSNGVGNNPSSTGVTAEISDSLKNSAAYTGWDFSSGIWMFKTGVNDDYPFIKDVPTLDPTTASDEKFDSAILQGNVVSNGSGTIEERGIEYAELNGSSNQYKKVTASSNGLGNYTVSLSGLLPGTQYYARAYAVNEAGTSYGEPIIFTTADATIQAGETIGTIKAVINEPSVAKFVVNITDSSVGTVNVGETAPTSGSNLIDNYNSGNDITNGVQSGKYIQIYDVDSNGKIVDFLEKQILEQDIKQDYISLPINEGFEYSGGRLPDNWAQEVVDPGSVGNNVEWSIVQKDTIYNPDDGSPQDIYPFNGSYMAMANFSSADQGATGRLSLYRDFYIAPGGLCQLSFYMYHTITSLNDWGPNDAIQPQISTDGGATWENLGDKILRESSSGPGWQQHTIDLNSYAGNYVRIGFLGISDYGNDVFIDNISVGCIVPLTAPIGISWDSIVPGKAQWDAAANAIGYSVQLKKNGSDQGSPVIVSNGTAYDFTNVIASAGSGTYTFNVTAIGDSTNYINSAVSNDSPDYTYTAPLIANISSVTAANGTVSIILDNVPTVTPTAADFTATSSIDGGVANSLTLTNFAWDSGTKTASFNFTPIAKAASSQSVVIAASYNGGTPVAASAFTVDAMTAANNPPTAKSSIPEQDMTDRGTASFTASDIAEDADSGDTLTITGIVTSPAPSVATAALNNGTVTVTGVSAGTTSIVVTVSDGEDTVDITVPIKVTTAVTVPGAPTDVAAAAGDGQATVSFTAPASDGGSAITSYTVTTTPGAITVTGPGSPITVTGLTNGTGYTFTVTATNAAGESAASAPSAVVTPSATTVTADISSVTAANGTVRIVLDNVPTVMPTAADFTATSSIDGGVANSLTLTNFAWDSGTKTASFNFTPIAKAASSQSVVIAASYNGGTPVAASAFTVDAMTQVAIPYANPSSGEVASGSVISLSCSTPGVSIYYTTDGSTPTVSSTLYTGKITIDSDTTIKAIAVKSGMADSPVMADSYTISSSHGSGSSGGSSSGNTSTVPNAPSVPTTVTGEVVDDGTGQTVSSIEAAVTTEADGTKTALVKPENAVVFKQPDGSLSTLSDVSMLGFTALNENSSSGSPNISTAQDGTLKISNLSVGTESKIAVTYDLGNGQKITIGTLDIKVDSSGKVNLTYNLIDPYGVIIDPSTGKPVAGVEVTLYYADTARNRADGKTPDAAVNLPAIDGFKPNNNKNPQVSDASGAYGFMVFPNTDYYIVAKKNGYEDYKSPTISVEKNLVKWNFKMNKPVTGVNRLEGSSRIDTAVQIAKSEYTGQIRNIILATADNYPDALSGSVLAYKLNAPILLVGSTDLEQQKVIDYMKSNMDSTGTVYILGGIGAVSSMMENKIASAGFKNITRLTGNDRYETAVKIAESLNVSEGTPIVLVNGDNYPDALSISSEAAVMGMPVLLIQKDGISDSVKNEIAKIKPSKIYVIGLEGVIGDKAANEASAEASFDKSNVIRIGGNDRYETSLDIAKYFNLHGKTICIATGSNFQDALAGSVYAADHNSPIILEGESLTQDEMNYLKSQKPTGAAIFGGDGAVGSNVEQQLSQLVGK